MFKKILVAEDSDGFNIAVGEVLKELSLDGTHCRYCDEAFLKVKKGLHDKEPFDLLITDLSFMPDHRTTNLETGEALIAAVKKIQPLIKIIAFSIEDSALQIQSLFEKHKIDGYVFKGRKSIPQLKEALHKVFKGSKYISDEISHQLHDKSLSEIDEYDIELLRRLASGYKVDEIAGTFKSMGMMPYSVSAIEKRIQKLKVYFGANNSIHLISLAKDLRVIK